MNSPVTRFVVALAVIGIVLPAGGCASDFDSQLRVLVLSGQNNHDWRKTTPPIKQILEGTGRFTVDVTEHPEQVTADTLAEYDVVVSNWNSFHRTDPPPVIDYPEATRQAYLDFVRGGKGFVTIHAGGSSFYDRWPEYRELAIIWYAFDQTAHGVRHAFPVRVADHEHPITAGMRDFMIHDELWHKPAFAPGSRVLAYAYSSTDSRGSGNFEPLVFVRQLGKGRCFATLLGHDAYSMSQPIFASLLARGTEWAATGKVTLPLPTDWPTTPAAVVALAASSDKALEAIRAYQFGQDRAALQTVEALANAAAGNPQEQKGLADRMAKVLAGEATIECRQFLCRHLGRIGSAEHVPALAPLLLDPQTTVAARGALEALGMPEASAALREALRSADGAIRVGLIHSLARCADAEAVPLLVSLAKQGDFESRASALAALGQVGNPATREALLAMKGALPEELTATWADAVLRCADRLLRESELEAAVPFYEALLAADPPNHVRTAALAGDWIALGEAGENQLWAALRGDDPVSQAAALRALREHGSERLLIELASRFRTLPDNLQAQAIALVASKRITAALPAVADAATHSNVEVRREALAALGVLGDESTVDVLLARLDGASTAEREIIGQSLAHLRGEGVNARMIALAKTAQSAHVPELVKALANRRAAEALPALFELARRDDAQLANEAVGAIGELGDADLCDELIDLLRKAEPPASVDAIRRALVQLSRRRPDEPAKPTLSALATADDHLAAELMPVLSTLGGSHALAAVCERAAAPNEDLRLAAVRALAAWREPSALEPLIGVAMGAPTERERILALRGFARLLRETRDAPTRDRNSLMEEAILLAQHPEEKKALIASAPAAPSEEVFHWLADCLNEPELADEAAFAALAMIEGSEEPHADRVTSTLRRILTVSTNDEIRARAYRGLARLGKLVNLAHGAKADSPDGLEPDLGGSEAPTTIDGDPATYWDEQNDQDLYRLRLTFDQPTTIVALAITGYKHHYAAPRGFSIVCDGQSVATVRDAVYANNVLTVTCPETTCTTLELEITDYYGPSPGIRELEVYGPLHEGDGDEALRLEWQRTDTTLTLLNRGRPLWSFHHGPDAAKPYFHPVALPDGTVLTWNAPADHPWHHGFWFSWKYINGVNYWEENRQTGHADGRTIVRRADVKTTGNAARIELTLHYGPPDAEPVLTEERVVEISPPDEAGVYHFDWTMTFAAGAEDAVLDRTPLSNQSDGRIWGGYAGLAFRLAQGFRELGAVSSSGEVTEWNNQRHRSKATAMEYHGRINGRRAGVAILDHADNLNAPSPWYLIDSDPMKYINPAVICYGPHTLPAHESFTLRYRVIVHPGWWDAAELQRQYNRFVQARQE